MEIMSFDSFEDAQRHMAEQTEAANARLSSQQESLTWGSYWVRFYNAGGDMLVIFGYCQTLEEYLESERRAGADDDEVEYARQTLPGNHDRGYLSGMAYSVVEPDGEPGDTHRYNAWPITKELFEEAKRAGWRMDGMEFGAYIVLQAIHEKWAMHERAKGL